MSSEMREFAGKADALAKRWRDDAKGFRERDMISAADDADFYAEELEAILPSAEADNGLYSPLTGAQEASMRGYCITQLQAVEDEYPDTGKFIREWLTHVENERNRLLAALLARTEAGADGEKGVNNPEWPLLDRVEFALRDAGFDYDEAFRIAHLAARPQDASGDAVPVLFGLDSGGDWYVNPATKSICVDVDFDPARQLSLILKPDGSVAWSIFVQEPDSSTTKATGPSVMNTGFYEALSYIAMQAKEAK